MGIIDIYLYQSLMFFVEQPLKLLLIPVFMPLIVGSIQDILADKSDDEYKPALLRNSEYQVQLQVIVRDASGGLVSVTEATHGNYIPHEITDGAFDNCFGPSICEKEIVVINNKKYEKVPFTQKYVMDEFYPHMKMKIRAIVQTEENTIVDADIFSILVPLIYAEEGDVVTTQWNILRELN